MFVLHTQYGPCGIPLTPMIRGQNYLLSTERNISLNSLLNKFTESYVKLRRDRKTEALRAWEPIVNAIVEDVKRRDQYGRFAKLRILPFGSYYERAKVGEPDEFDLMLVMDNLELDGDPYGSGEDDGLSEPPTGFTTVMIDQGEEKLWQPDQCVNHKGMLSAARVKSVFVRLIREAIQALPVEYRSMVTNVTCHGPAVTLKITNRNGSRVYSIDLTLVIKDKSWPEDAEEWKSRDRKGWPSQSLVRKIYQNGCHLVTKPPKGYSVPEREKEFLWRYSFSASIKQLFLEGGHGERSSCRKQVFRILKALREELHLQPLKSYHLKTILLYECEANPLPNQWSSSCLGDRFLGLLDRLERCLLTKKCPHYIMKEVNLFELFDRQKCSELAKRIGELKSQPEKELSKLIMQYKKT